MAKNNFILYKDFDTTLDLLNDEQAGKLFKAIYKYVNGRNEPNFNDGMLKVSFNIVKIQLERDLVKYNNRVEISRENGKLGGRPKDKPKEPSGLIKTQSVKNKAKKGDSVSVSVRDSVNDSDKKDKKNVVYFDNSKLNNLFNDFLKLRKQLKAKNTDRAITLLTNELNKHDDNIKIQMIEKSIMNSWKSVFPLNGKDIKQDKPLTDRYKNAPGIR